jgi:hypothetical protein
MTLADLQSIGLAELVEKASLLTRVDRKYVLGRLDAAEVLAALDPSTRILEIDARRRRFKLRTRSYVDTAESWLEVKTRGARSTTVKDRLAYDIGDRDILTVDGREYADAALDGLGLRGEELELRPTLVTRYHRATLYLPASGSRATVDTDLSWEGDDGHVLSTPDLAIIETKSGTRTSEVDRLLWAHGHRPATISKFGTGLAALRSDLPSNKWARVLRRYFRSDAS